jgi:hypothetical protein
LGRIIFERQDREADQGEARERRSLQLRAEPSARKPAPRGACL